MSDPLTAAPVFVLPHPDDVSPRVVELMQRLDRMPPGVYLVEVVKPEVRAADWAYEIMRVEKMEQGKVSKYQPE